MNRYTWLVLGCISFTIVGCTSLVPAPSPFDNFTSPDEFTLYSLRPAMEVRDGGDPKDENFHGHTVVGKTAVSAEDQKKLADAFRKGVADHDNSVAGCFLPHHGMRMTQDDRMVDLVICFKCAQVLVYAPDGKSSSILISTSPRKTFDEVLTKAGVPLGEKSE